MKANNFYSATDVVKSHADASSHLPMPIDRYDVSKSPSLSSVTNGVISGEYSAVILVGYGGVAIPSFIVNAIDCAFQRAAPDNDIRHICVFVDQHKKSKVPTYLKMRVPSGTPSDSILKVLPDAISGITHSFIIAGTYTGEIGAGVAVVRLWDISPIKDGKRAVTIQVSDIHGESPDEVLETGVVKKPHTNAFNAFLNSQSLSAGSRMISLLDNAIKRIRLLSCRGSLKGYVETIGTVEDDNTLPVSIHIANGTLMATFTVDGSVINTSIAWMGRLPRAHGQIYTPHWPLSINQFHEEYYAGAVKHGNNLYPAVELSTDLINKARSGEAITVNFEGFPIGKESATTTVNNLITNLVGPDVAFKYINVTNEPADVRIRLTAALNYLYGSVFTKEIVTKDKIYLSRYYHPGSSYTPHVDYQSYTTLDLSKCSPEEAAKQLADLYYGDIEYTFAAFNSTHNEFIAWPTIRYDNPLKIVLNPKDRRAISLALTALSQ